MSSAPSDPAPQNTVKKKYRKAITPGLKRLLYVLFALFAVLGANSMYLVTITGLEAATGETYQNYFYQYMFLAHLVLGIAIVVPVIVFGMRYTSSNTLQPPEPEGGAGRLRAVHRQHRAPRQRRDPDAGLDFFEVRDPTVRKVSYWAHVIAPLVVAWLFVLHRLAGRRIKWKDRRLLAGGGGRLRAGHGAAPLPGSASKWNVSGPESGEQYFFPSLSRTATGNFIPAETMMMDQYCVECHADVHETWSHSVHRFSSFNNPVYLFSVRGTRAAMMERDGDVQGLTLLRRLSRPRPVLLAAPSTTRTSTTSTTPRHRQGITCTACHAITNVNSTQGQRGLHDRGALALSLRVQRQPGS